MPRVLLTTCGPHWPYARQTPGGTGNWEDFEFVIDQNDVECDAWVVFDNPTKPLQARCDPNNTLFISAEPPDIRTYGNDFLNQFRWLLTCHELPHRGRIPGAQCQPWHVGVDCDNNFASRLDYDCLSSLPRPPKNKLISAVISDKTTTAGHRLRLQFVRMLKERLGDQFDIFGRGHQPIGDKWEAIEPYRFHLALENTSLKHYVTEKIGDAFLGHAFPFYAGASNIDTYFPAGSFQSIDLSDLEHAVSIVCDGIEKQLDLQRRHQIEAARSVVLNEMNLFAAIVRLLRGRMARGPRKTVRIYPKSHHIKLAWSGLNRQLFHAASDCLRLPKTSTAKNRNTLPRNEKMQNAVVDILMPVYNAERFLAAAVCSMLHQSHKNFRLICIDDGSTDRTPTILRSLAAGDDRVSVIHQPNQGIVAALNRGLQACDAPLVARMDADDVAMPDRLQQQVRFLTEEPEVVAVGSGILEIDSESNPLSMQSFAATHEPIVSGLLQLKTGLAHPAAMIRRSAINAVGGYDATYEGVEDVDLWFRLAEIGQLANLPHTLLCYRQHAASICWSGSVGRNEKLIRLLNREYSKRGMPVPKTLAERCRSTRAQAGPSKWARRAARAGQWNVAINHLRRQWANSPTSPVTWRMSAEVIARLVLSAAQNGQAPFPRVPSFSSPTTNVADTDTARVA